MEILDIRKFENIRRFRERKEIHELEDYINSNKPISRIKIISGLRRSGKTTLLIQTCFRVIEHNPMLIQVQRGDEVSDILKVLEEYNGKYIFIDEITEIEDIYNINLLFDKISMQGKKIVISGTYSMIFNILLDRILYDRATILNLEPLDITTYKEVLGDIKLDKYLKNNGLFSDFYHNETLIDSLSENILKSLEKSEIYDTFELNTVKSIVLACFLRVVWTENIESLQKFKAIGIRNSDIDKINKHLEEKIKNINPYLNYTDNREIQLVLNELNRFGILKLQNGFNSNSKDKKLIVIPGILEYLYGIITEYCINNNIFFSKRAINGFLFEKNMNIQSYLVNNQLKRYHLELTDMEFDEIIQIEPNKYLIVDYKVTNDIELLKNRLEIDKAINKLKNIFGEVEFEYRIVFQGNTAKYKGIKIQNTLEFLKEMGKLEVHRDPTISWWQ